MKVILFALFSAFVVGTMATENDDKKPTPEQQFNEFQRKYNRTYKSPAEQKHRLEIFTENLKKIEKLQKKNRGTAVYGVTQFADLTGEEFEEMHTGSLDDEVPIETLSSRVDLQGKLPKHIDWRKKKAVSSVKDQGGCGSCWAFAVVGNIESLWAIKHKRLYSLSEQELVDCDLKNSGCIGGSRIAAYKAVIRLGGLQTDKTYPYVHKQQQCKIKNSKIVVKISSFVSIPKNETVIAHWVAKSGPVGASINPRGMHHYLGGIVYPDEDTCPPIGTVPKQRSHAVLIVGYGVEKEVPFWIIKNSWGKGFGENGYYRLYRGDNVCGIARLVSSAIL